MARVTKYLDSKELECKCGKPGCRKLPIFGNDQLQFLEGITILRENIGLPIFVNSYFRCPQNSAYTPESGHSSGIAIDIRSNCDLVRIYTAAEKIGFNGMGYSEDGGFIHLDSKPRIARWKYEGPKHIFLFCKEIAR